jgi:hypothetical protein
MRRRGIALLITIAFITAIAALIGIAGGILKEGFAKTSRKALLVQSNVLLSDSQMLLRQNTKDINGSETLDILLSLPLFFSDKKTGIMTDLSFTSGADAVNVNRLLEVGTAKATGTHATPIRATYEAYFERILAYYDVADTALLISMIADTIDDDLNERLPGSEIALQSPDFTQGHIFDLHHFRQILTAYKRQTLDFNVDTIPWEKLISFRNDGIDFNHITPDALRFIVPDVDGTTVADLTTGRVEVYNHLADLPLSPEDIKTLEDMNVTFYSPLVIGKMNMMSNKRKISYTFTYNLSTQEVSQFAIAD